MSILNLLGLKKDDAKAPAADTETVRRVIKELDALEPERARYTAAFAYILSRVANADLEISEVETQKMEDIVRQQGHLPPAQAVLVVKIAKSQNMLFGHTEDYLVTREFKEISTPDQRRELLGCLFAVSAADDSISSSEEAQIRQIASELGLSHQDFINARLNFSDKRDVLKGLPK